MRADLSPEAIKVLTELHVAIIGLTTTVAETAEIDVDEVASTAGVCVEVTNSVIDRFALAPAADMDAIADRFLDRAHRARIRRRLITESAR